MLRPSPNHGTQRLPNDDDDDYDDEEYCQVHGHSRIICRPLGHFDDLTILLHCRSSASLSHML